MLSPARERLERYFEFNRLGTNWRTELLAGITTFMKMAYIIFVNPSILRETGMPYQAIVGATCFCAGFSPAYSWAPSHVHGREGNGHTVAARSRHFRPNSMRRWPSASGCSSR
jgi:hypothetical protein